MRRPQAGGILRLGMLAPACVPAGGGLPPRPYPGRALPPGTQAVGAEAGHW
jgi:hypothetical protein